MDKFAQLNIDLHSKGLLSLSPGSDLPVEVWNSRVVNFWASNLDSAEEPARLPVSVLAAQTDWLLTWRRAGFSLQISEKARDAIKAWQGEHSSLEDVEEPVQPHLDFDLLARPLTNEQQRNVRLILSRANGADFSVPGAGKTATALAVYAHLKSFAAVSQLIVVAPKSAFEAWHDEPTEVLKSPPMQEIYSGHPPKWNTELLIVNYEQLESRKRLDDVLQWMGRGSTLLVLDEAHRVKAGAAGARWRACRELSLAGSRRLVLTGTPMPQGLSDLENLMELSWPGHGARLVSQAGVSNLSKRKLFVRTTKSELNLPPVKIRSVSIPMGDLHASVYSALRNRYSGFLRLKATDELTLASKGKAVMTLLGAATNPGLIVSGPSHMDPILGMVWPPTDIAGDSSLLDALNNYSRHEIPSKYLWLSSYVQEAVERGQKVLVWSSFIGSLHALKRLLQPHSPALIYGAVPLTSDSEVSRKSELARFRKDPNCKVLLANPQTLGEGVSLHDVCHIAVYVDRTYNAGHYLQSIDRIHRLGLDPEQETEVVILQSEGTIDDRVASRLETKIARLAKVLDDPEVSTLTMPSEFDFGDLGLTQDDLNDLLDHLRDEK